MKFNLKNLCFCIDNSGKRQTIDEEKVGDGTNLTLMNSDNEEDNKHLKSVKTSAGESQSKCKNYFYNNSIQVNIRPCFIFAHFVLVVSGKI